MLHIYIYDISRLRVNPVFPSILRFFTSFIIWNYSRTPIIRINWDAQPSGYAENPDNWIFLSKYATLAV